MARERLTWHKDAETNKQASPPPQTPNAPRTTPADHPAAYQDPDADKYETGDPSSWAEDPHPPPYDEAAAPATPGYQEPADHPAAKPGKPMKASENERRATERKAAKCIRIATAILGDAGKDVSEEQHVAAIENHALDLMDLPDENIKSMLQRMGMDEDDDEDEDDDSGKEASMSVTAARDIMAAINRLESGLSRIADHMGLEASSLFAQMDEEMEDMEAMTYADDDEDMTYADEDEEEAMLEEMLADAHGRSQNDPEYGYAGMEEEMDMVLDDSPDDMEEDMDEEEMLAMMLSGMGDSHYAADENGDDDDDDDGDDDDDDDDDEDQDSDDDKVEDDDGKEGGKKAAEEDIVMAADADPMGLMDESPTPDASELAKLYMTADDEGSAAAATEVTAAKKSEDNGEGNGDDDEKEAEEEEEEEKKENGKKAGLKPQPKKPSKGAQALGSVQKVASSEAGVLDSLWEHAPDVSSAFS